MEQILLVYGLATETVSAVMILYKNTKPMVLLVIVTQISSTSFAGVLQGDTLAPCMFINCLNYVL